jgi:hypothetical protein
MAKYQREYLNYESANLIQDNKHDFLNITSYNGGIVYDGKIPFLIHCLTASRLYDIIHLHDSWFMILPLRILYPRKKIIIHYHGSLVRNNTLGKKRKFLERFVNQILIATPDLYYHQYRTEPIYVPDPIDDKLFSKQYEVKQNHRAFVLLKHNQDEIELRNMLIDLGFGGHVETQKRVKGYANGTQYKDFPNKLKDFEYYIDIPIINNEIIPSHSCAGLQALSMGLKVVRWDGETVEGLPEIHTPEYVVNFLDDIYKKILRG